MRILINFLTIFNILIPFLDIGPVSVPAILKSISFTPLYLNKKSYISINPNGSAKVKISIINDLYPNGALICEKSILKGKKYLIEYDNSYTRSSNKIKLEIISLNQTILSTISDIAVASGRSTLVGNNNQIKSDYELLSYIPDIGWSTETVTYDMFGFDKYYIPDYYHKVDVSDFKIKNPEKLGDLFSCLPSLTIKNVDGLFDDLCNSSSSTSLNLNVVKVEQDIFSFELSNTLYVDEETLKMSLTPKEGYVPTQYIYLPRDEMRRQEEFQFTFLLNEFGIDKDRVIHSITVKSVLNTLGDCHNSEYCVTNV